MKSAAEQRILKNACKGEIAQIRKQMKTIDALMSEWEKQDRWNYGHEGTLADMRSKLADILDGWV